eukprot:CAMPEP_0117539976 /NCGR_PEP_ID=MMETSP0784-20121206/43262_1 /TAXON_ID=39447 /ORGANISM="" /LENGTH=273 /DNA_ID=CAMNT_0005336619 /DNA_START=178 /DNA_END=999 /DNA_ORIENTATION=+
MKVLMYWAVAFDPKVVDLVVANVDHLQAKGLQFDVLLGHYDMKRESWVQRNESWYRQNVRWGVSASGFKVHLLQTIHAQRLAPGLKLLDYDWLWLLDEDVDLTNLQPPRFFKDLAASEALIASPAFTQKIRSKTGFESPYYPMNTPQPGMLFRYVPMIEVIMPIMRPQVLTELFDCGDNLAPMNSDWGIDHIWCSFSARRLFHDRYKTCAVLDRSGPVVHKNYGSTRKSGRMSTFRAEGNEAVMWLKSKFMEDYQSNHFHSLVSWEGYESVPV